MANPIMDWIVQNFFLIYLFFFNLVLIVVLIRLRALLGPFFVQSIRVSFGMMKDPNFFIHFLNSKVAVLEWRAYNQVIKLDPEDATSELVYLDRQNSFTPGTPTPKKIGFIDKLLGKNDPKIKANTIYSDNFVPVQLDSNRNFYLFGRQMHVIYEGQNTSQNPLANFSQDSQVKKAGIAVEHALTANRLLAESEFRNKIATKDDVRNMGLLNLVLLGIGIVAVIVMVMGLQSGLDTFSKFAMETYDKYKPAIDAFLNDIPRVVQGE